MRAASATVRTNIGVLPRSGAQRSQRRKSRSLCGETITENIPRQSSWGVVGVLGEPGVAFG